jgi:hypothetical protein
MTDVCSVAAGAAAAAVAAKALDARDLSRYRAFELGAGIAAICALTGIAAADATAVEVRAALVHELEWRPSRRTTEPAGDPTDVVERVVFSFLDDRLFRILVDYGSDRAEARADTDLIEVISVVYMPTLKRSRAVASVPGDVDVESGSPMARWTDAKHAVVLYGTSTYRNVYRLIVTDDVLADYARQDAAPAAVNAPQS